MALLLDMCQPANPERLSAEFLSILYSLRLYLADLMKYNPKNEMNQLHHLPHRSILCGFSRGHALCSMSLLFELLADVQQFLNDYK